jgi:phosphoribosylanthranilate isomerase
MRTRIKICGITRPEDARSAVANGVDAIGFIQWRKSPRFIEPDRAGQIASDLPPLVSCVAVFVNPTTAEVEAAIRAIPAVTLQFHGEESPEFCAGFGRPWIKAGGAKPGRDLLKYFSDFNHAAAWLVDKFNDQLYGGTGSRFDWNLVPKNPGRPLILSGGLDAESVGEAIRTIHPYAIDVSSGVEIDKGIKDPEKIATFMTEVRRADQRSTR